MAPARKIAGLDCGESFRSAAGKIIWTRFEEMMSCADAAVAGIDPEGIHDMRVACRRLRAALELFRDVFPQRNLAPYRRKIKDLADALGKVRDLDVMIDRLAGDQQGRPLSQQQVLQDMVADLEQQRLADHAALDDTIARLTRADFGRQFLTFVAQETA